MTALKWRAEVSFTCRACGARTDGVLCDPPGWMRCGGCSDERRGCLLITRKEHEGTRILEITGAELLRAYRTI